jgi:hypothetical protein
MLQRRSPIVDRCAHKVPLYKYAKSLDSLRMSKKQSDTGP